MSGIRYDGGANPIVRYFSFRSWSLAGVIRSVTLKMTRSHDHKSDGSVSIIDCLTRVHTL